MSALAWASALDSACSAASRHMRPSEVRAQPTSAAYEPRVYRRAAGRILAGLTIQSAKSGHKLDDLVFRPVAVVFPGRWSNEAAMAAMRTDGELDVRVAGDLGVAEWLRRRMRRMATDRPAALAEVVRDIMGRVRLFLLAARLAGAGRSCLLALVAAWQFRFRIRSQLLERTRGRIQSSKPGRLEL